MWLLSRKSWPWLYYLQTWSKFTEKLLVSSNIITFTYNLLPKLFSLLYFFCLIIFMHKKNYQLNCNLCDLSAFRKDGKDINYRTSFAVEAPILLKFCILVLYLNSKGSILPICRFFNFSAIFRFIYPLNRASEKKMLYYFYYFDYFIDEYSSF